MGESTEKQSYTAALVFALCVHLATVGQVKERGKGQCRLANMEESTRKPSYTTAVVFLAAEPLAKGCATNCG